MIPEQVAEELLSLRGRTAAGEQLQELIDASVRYARIRVDWALMEHGARGRHEIARTSSHNVLIDACNILSRAMARAGEPNEWRSQLGTDRRVIGDMACHLHCLLGLGAR